MICLAFTILISSIFIFHFPQSIYAQSLNGLTISPGIVLISIEPGESLERAISINAATKSRYQVEIVQLEKDENNEKTELKISDLDIPTDWITLQSSELDTEMNDQIDYSIKFSPLISQSLGSYILGIRFTEDIKENVNESSAIAQPEIIIPILINVISEDLEKISLMEDLGIIELKPKEILNFTEEVPLKINLRNAGLTYLIPKGVLKIKNDFTSEEINFDFNNENKTILRDSFRNFDRSVKVQSFLPAKYSVELSVVYGESNKIIQATTEFWYVNPLFILVLLILLIGAIISTYRYKTKNK